MKQKLVRNSNSNISMQLYELLKEDILKNTWKENQKFYSIRQVSIKFSVNPNTVLKVYQTLEEEGYLYSVQGKGSFIKKGYQLDVSERMIPILNTFRFGQNLGHHEVNFSNGAPPKKYFPIREYQSILAEILCDVDEAKNLLGYQDIKGLESLRRVLSHYMKGFGIFVDQEEIVICSGTQNVLELVSSTFASHAKRRVLLSNPTYQNAVQILKHSCQIETIDLKADGWDMEELEDILQKTKIHFVYLMTNFQNPTGVSWSHKKKLELLNLAKKYDFYIVEDECFSDFYYDKQSPRSLKALDRGERVFYVKTFSKIVMPGVGLAMLIPPKPFVERFSIDKYFIDTTTSGIHQRFLELFISRGLLDSHLSHLRSLFKRKMEYMIEHLQKISHIQILHIPKGGFFIWLALAPYIDAEKFYYKCRLQGVSILPGFIFYHNKQNTCKIRISVVSSTMEEMKKGLHIMQNILENCDGVSNLSL